MLQEFYVQAARESRTGRLTHEQAALFIEALLRFPVDQPGAQSQTRPTPKAEPAQSPKPKAQSPVSAP